MNFVFIAFIVLLNIQNDSEWKKSLDKDEIVIYTRKNESSSIQEFLAKAEMEGSISKFREVMSDVDDYENWMPDVKSTEIIEENSENDFTYHMKLKVPFPFTKRDIVQQLIFTGSDKELIIDILNKPDAIEVSEDFVRMPGGDGRWTIHQISENKISINFQYLTDPGGGIPAWLVNSFIVKNPHKTLLNIKKKLQE